MSIPDVAVADEIIDTSSLFYDVLFNHKHVVTEASAGLNPLEKSILLKWQRGLADLKVSR
ncbi:protein of unknown function [Moritella yayanosii]|uniref:Uncharacterized protein n=1 Tax=Moritella yayanosii TaxID=69539 RepID=A0A330LU11_9GAMM|nr:protein of unknown function [Moritella yayanosii]